MFYKFFWITCLVYLPQIQSDPRTTTRRYKPVIQVTEEIDVNDITFTTSLPEHERSPSQNHINYYNAVKPEVIKEHSYGRIPETVPIVHPHVTYKDSYGTPISVEKFYGTIPPKVVPVIKYKPYKVYKVPNGHDAYRAVSLVPKTPEKQKVLHFDAPTSFSAIAAADPTKSYSAKVVPFTSQYTSGKTPARPSNFHASDKQNFIPSPTFSPTVLAKIKGEESDIKSLNSETKELERSKPTKKPYQTEKVYENHSMKPVISSPEYSADSDKVEQNHGPSSGYQESPKNSESFLSEISTLHKTGDNVEAGGEALDLKQGERVEFQMYGMDGPESYKFGFDTGKGQNRHFRFEERDKEGRVKGHYGYLDEEGKMRIMKYEADPITGFHAGPVEISEDEH